jgi:peptidoglycan/LPS O-acetylase OafA/YrhL
VRSARIESLRALAALAVLVGHVYGVANGFELTSFEQRLGLAGGFGVWMFFALTGYLLFWPFVQRNFCGGARVDLRRYALNRVLRVLPLYYVVLAVLLILNEHGGSLTQWVRFGTFTQSLFSDTVGSVDGPMWSLVVELCFYALLPPLAWLVALVARGSMTRACVALLGLAAVSLVVWYVTVHRVSGTDLRWRYSLPATLYAFVPGMLIALARARLSEVRDTPRLPSSTVLVLLSVPLWLLAVQFVGWAQPLSAMASFLVLAAVVLPMRDGRLVRALDFRPLAAIGVASYSIYLWHLPIVDSVERATGVGFIELLGAALAVCLTVAAFSYFAIERPFLRLRRRWGPPVAIDAQGSGERIRATPVARSPEASD